MENSDELYQEAFKPFREVGGTPYPTSQESIDFHKAAKFNSKNKGPFLSRTEATTALMLHNELGRRVPPREQLAIEDLQDLILDVEDGCSWGPDLAVKCFRDLDIVFFEGKLSGHVCVLWSSRPLPFLSTLFRTQVLGITEMMSPLEFGKTRIILNATTILRESSSVPAFELMFLTLIHEMIHAYEFVVSPRLTFYFENAHCGHFQTRVHAIHERCMRLFNIRAIGGWEGYMQHHVLKDSSFQGLGCGGEIPVKKGEVGRWNAAHVRSARNGGGKKKVRDLKTKSGKKLERIKGRTDCAMM